MPTEFPIAAGDDDCFVSVCPSCGRDTAEVDGLISLQGGAHLMSEDRRSGGPSDRLAGYLMTFVQETIDGRFVEQRNMIVDNIRGGQFNIFWCSLGCMRQSLNDIVDELERQLQNRGEPDDARESPS